MPSIGSAAPLNIPIFRTMRRLIMIPVFIFLQSNSTASGMWESCFLTTKLDGRFFRQSPYYLLLAEKRIIGGTSIASAEIPFICSIRQRMPAANSWNWWTYTHQCGGTVVNGNWLLTSAHCIFGKDIASLLVVCGYGQGRSIERVALKPDYIHGRRGNDLALVRVLSGKGREIGWMDLFIVFFFRGCFYF